MGGGRDGCRLYLITPPRLDPVAFADQLAAALDAGDVAAVQLRLKDVDDDAWRRAIDALRPVAQSRGVAFLLNDRADLVRATGCDGAHVGQEDIPAREARALMGPDATLGVTCKGSRDLAMRRARTARTMSRSARSFRPAPRRFPEPSTPRFSQWWSELMELPCCAIGGITAANCRPAGAGRR